MLSHAKVAFIFGVLGTLANHVCTEYTEQVRVTTLIHTLMLLTLEKQYNWLIFTSTLFSTFDLKILYSTCQSQNI